jgi:biopolymer transport protein ExbB/TolQ
MHSFDLMEMWRSMAPLAKLVNILLAICSVYSLWVIVDRAIVLRSVKKKSVNFMLQLQGQLKSRNLDGAMQLAMHVSDSPVARLVREALIEYLEGLDAMRALPPHETGDFDLIDAVTRVIDRTKEREVSDLKKGLGGLASISSAAPFIGLFGTVVGIINAFQSMAQSGQGGLGAVSAGISEALFTTAVGLMVAIPAVMLFNYYSTVIERFVVDINGVSGELVSFMIREELSAPLHQQQQQQHHSPHPHAHPSHSHQPHAQHLAPHQGHLSQPPQPVAPSHGHGGHHGSQPPHQSPQGPQHQGPHQGQGARPSLAYQMGYHRR